MRRIFVLALLALGLASCGDYAARREMLNEHTPQSLAELRDATLAPFHQWQQEPSHDCGSLTLLEARASVLHTALMTKPQRDGFEAAYDAATWMLDVADGAAAYGCANTARDLYNKVQGLYVGGGYIRLRERAALGTEHLGS